MNLQQRIQGITLQGQGFPKTNFAYKTSRQNVLRQNWPREPLWLSKFLISRKSRIVNNFIVFWDENARIISQKLGRAGSYVT